MYCKQCGKEMPNSAKFCAGCGTNVLSESPYAAETSELINIEDNGSKNRIKIIILIIIVIVVAAILFLVLNRDVFTMKEQISDSEVFITEENKDKYSDTASTSSNDGIRVDKAGEIIEFGKWRGAPIAWRVLDVQNDKLLLLSEDVLTIRQYDGLEEQYGERLKGVNTMFNNNSVTWADSNIREWLNGEFLNIAFSKDELNGVLTTEVLCTTVGWSSTLVAEIGPNTEDKVFLLSLDEVSKYFHDGDVFADIGPQSPEFTSSLRAYIEMSEEDLDYYFQMEEEDGPKFKDGYDDWEKGLWEKGINEFVERYLGKRESIYWMLRDVYRDTFYNSLEVCLVAPDFDSSSNRAFHFGLITEYSTRGVRPAIWVEK